MARLPSPLYHAMDLNEALEALSHTWVDTIIQEARLHGTPVKTRGRGPGSLESEETAGLDYTVLDGEGVREFLPGIWKLYHDLVPEIAHRVGHPVHVSEHVPSSINVNVLQGEGARYEAHVDAQPYTLLLFVTSHSPSQGGRLILGDAKQEVGIPPRSGHGVLFDGASIPHRVEPLRRSKPPRAIGIEDLLRVSMPWTYLPEGVSAADRPAGLDDYLFKAGEK